MLKKAKSNNLVRKLKSKEYYDSRHNVKKSNMQEGDLVLMKRERKGKLLTKFETTPAKVIDIKGTAITISRNGSVYVRNMKDLKKISNKTDCESYDDISDNSEFEEIYEQNNSVGDLITSGSEGDDQNIEENGVLIQRPVRERRTPARYEHFIRY